MKKIFTILGALLLSGTAVSFVSCEEKNQDENKQLMGEVITSDYLNPVYGAEAADPSVIRARDGKFYAYSTNAQIMVSEDLVNWENLDGAFQGTTYPNWLISGAVWAPDVHERLALVSVWIV